MRSPTDFAMLCSLMNALHSWRLTEDFVVASVVWWHGERPRNEPRCVLFYVKMSLCMWCVKFFAFAELNTQSRCTSGQASAWEATLESAYFKASWLLHFIHSNSWTNSPSLPERSVCRWAIDLCRIMIRNKRQKQQQKIMKENDNW